MPIKNEDLWALGLAVGIAAAIAMAIFTVLIAVVILVVRLPEGPSDKEIEQAKANGDLIIEAITKYKQDHDGDPPQELNELVPAYLKSVPLPSQGEGSWSYAAQADGSVYLGYDFGTWNPAIFTTGGQWAVDTK